MIVQLLREPASSVMQDYAYSFIPTTDDVDDDVLTFNGNNPSWLTNRLTGELYGTPTILI